MDWLNKLQTFLDQNGDPRVQDWPLMKSPFPTWIICISFAYLMKVQGPKLMKDRKPFELRRWIIVYNFLQVVFSSWLVFELLASGWWGEYSFRCQPIDRSESGARMAAASWWYFISKFTEFIDTLFFVLRKKFDHVSLLHIIHHGVMPASGEEITFYDKLA